MSLRFGLNRAICDSLGATGVQKRATFDGILTPSRSILIFSW